MVQSYTRAPTTPGDFLLQGQVDTNLRTLHEDYRAAVLSPDFNDAAASVFPRQGDEPQASLMGPELAVAVQKSLSCCRALQDSVAAELSCNAAAIGYAACAFLGSRSAGPMLCEDAEQVARTAAVSRDQFPDFVRFFLAYRVHCYFHSNPGDLGRPPTAKASDANMRTDVVFVLGGPGAGKATQCMRISETFGFYYLRSRDLLSHAERQPAETAVKLFLNAMDARGQTFRKFVIDGFPRDLDDLKSWDRLVGRGVRVEAAILLDCSEESRKARLADRSRPSTEGKAIRRVKSIETYREESLPVVDALHTRGVLRRVSATWSVEEVWNSVRSLLGPTVVFVLGGCGSGKTTLSRRIAKSFGYSRISVGELLHEESQTHFETSASIRSSLSQRQSVRSDLTVGLMLRELELRGWARGRYVIDGFPRSLENWECWKGAVRGTVLVKHCLYLECSEGRMEARVMERLPNGWGGDELQAIRASWMAFYRDHKPIVHRFRAEGLLRRFDADQSGEDNWDQAQVLFAPSVIFVIGSPQSQISSQCAQISEVFGYQRLGMDEVLRSHGAAEDATSKVVVELLLRSMEQRGWDGGKYVVEGFPRSCGDWHCWRSMPGRKVRAGCALLFEEAAASSPKNSQDAQGHMPSGDLPELLNGDGILHRVDGLGDFESVWAKVKEHLGPSVIMVLGAPGSGKRTQSARICEHFEYRHLDLEQIYLREKDSASESPRSAGFRRPGFRLEDDLSVSAEALVRLLQREMERNCWEGGKYLIENFPRCPDDWACWQRNLGGRVSAKAALFLECSEAAMERRRLGQGGVDIEGVRGRIRAHRGRCVPILETLQAAGLLRKVNAEQDVDAVWSCTQEVLDFELNPHLKNTALVLIHPHAYNEVTERFVRARLANNDIAVVRAGAVPMLTVFDRGLFERHFVEMIGAASRSPSELFVTREGASCFQQAMGVSWADAIASGRVLSAADAVAVLGLAAADLADAWRQVGAVQVAESTWVASMPMQGADARFVVNGFALHWRNEYRAGGDQLKWLVVEFSSGVITWRRFLEEVVGCTDPAKAERESIRGQLHQHWQTLGLQKQPTVIHNCVHASASPIEGLRECLLWAGGERMEGHPVARSLLACGIPKSCIEGWLNNEKVQEWGSSGRPRNGPIFACSRASDHAQFRADALRYVASIGATTGVSPWPVEVESSSRDVAQAQEPSDTGQTFVGKVEVMTILHFNDVYNVEPRKKEPVGGIARFVTRMKELKQEAFARGEPPICLFSGDAFNPSLTSTATKGKHMVPALNAVGINTACYGNHDFDFGVDELVELAAETNFPWLISNVVDRAMGKPLAKGQPTRMVDWHGRKIGLMGLVEREWLVTLHTLEPSDVVFEDFCDCARRLGRQLREDGADVVIALTHMRVPNDELLANEVAELDLILGGHDHHYDVKPVGPHGTYVLKSGTDFRDITAVRLRFNDGAGRRAVEVLHTQHVEIVSSITPDPTMQELVDDCIAKVGKSMDKVLGETAVDLDGRFSSIRTQETNLGNFVADVMRAGLKADIAMLNSGTLRADAILEKGAFRMRDLCSLLPMLDEMCLLELTGAQVLEVLENGVSKYPRLEGRFLQVSGVSFTFDAARPEGSRLVDGTVVVGGAPIDTLERYRVCTLNFLRQGKDGFTVFKDATCLADGEQAGILPTIVREHFLNIAALNGYGEAGAYRTKRLASKKCGLARITSVAGDVPAMQDFAIHPEVDGRIMCLSSPTE
mmetsp:Transcript_82483/g.229958  ORF Transcript_82483/g.229958 Transcript_82483/m.229958 type:complete len:1740 (-) Transcript_82483:51-5270(-)